MRKNSDLKNPKQVLSKVQKLFTAPIILNEIFVKYLISPNRNFLEINLANFGNFRYAVEMRRGFYSEYNLIITFNSDPQHTPSIIFKLEDTLKLKKFIDKSIKFYKEDFYLGYSVSFFSMPSSPRIKSIAFFPKERFFPQLDNEKKIHFRYNKTSSQNFFIL